MMDWVSDRFLRRQQRKRKLKFVKKKNTIAFVALFYQAESSTEPNASKPTESTKTLKL